MTAQIRPIAPNDVSDVHTMLCQLAEIENSVHLLTGTVHDLADGLFGEIAPLHGLVAEADGTLAGCLLWTLGFSTWTCRPCARIVDLFVAEDVRGSGIGAALFAAVSAAAGKAGAVRIDWRVHHDNDTAKHFYRRQGATADTDWESWCIALT